MLRFGRRSGVNNPPSVFCHPLRFLMFTIHQWITTGHVKIVMAAGVLDIQYGGTYFNDPHDWRSGFDFPLCSPSDK